MTDHGCGPGARHALLPFGGLICAGTGAQYSPGVQDRTGEHLTGREG
jgi:hypothetical protein